MSKEFDYPLEIQQAFLEYVAKRKELGSRIPTYNERYLFSTGFDSDHHPIRMYHTYDASYDPDKDPRTHPIYRVSGHFPEISHAGFWKKEGQFKPVYIYILGEVTWEQGFYHRHPVGDRLSVNFENAFATSCDFQLGETKLGITYRQDGSELIQINYNGVKITPDVAEAIGLVIPNHFDIDGFTDRLFSQETLADPINAPVDLDRSWKLADLIKASGVRLPI